MQALKATIAYIFVALVLSQSVNLTLVKTHWQINCDFIAKNLCINRFNPDSDCKGQCVLMQKLHNEAEREAEQKAMSNPLFGFNFFCDEIESPYLTADYKAVIPDFKIQNEMIIAPPFFGEINHPPEV